MFGLEAIYRHYNLQLFLCSGLLTLSSANYGFDVAGFAKTQAMTPFIQRFGQCNAQGQACFLPSYWLSMFNSLPFLAHICGIYVGSTISARFGRRWTCFTMSLWACVGATIVVTAQTKEHIMVGRILSYIYVGMELSVIPIYQSEIMPAPVRGFAVASYQMSFSLGNIFSSVIAKITNEIPNDWSWRIVFLFYYVVPVIVASSIWFIPESPRWLISKGRTEQARTALKRLRVVHDEASIEEELRMIQAGIDAANTKGTWADMFKGPNKRRTLIVLGSNFFQQATGQAFISIYGPLFVRSLNFIDIFLWGIIQSLCGLVVVVISMCIVDRAGRRPMMIGGSFSQGMWMLLCGILSTLPNQNYSIKMMTVISTLFFGMSYSFAWAPINYIITAELSVQQLRDKTQRVGSWMNMATNFVVTFSLPYMMNEPGYLGGKVGFILGFMCFLACTFAYFCVPECKGRSYEEVNMLFQQRIPARHSRQWQPSAEDLAELNYGGISDNPKAMEIEEIELKSEEAVPVNQKK